MQLVYQIWSLTEDYLPNIKVQVNIYESIVFFYANIAISYLLQNAKNNRAVKWIGISAPERINAAWLIINNRKGQFTWYYGKMVRQQ